MRKGGSFWYSFVLDDIFLFFQASLSEENQANYINQASQALLQHRQFQSEAGHTRLHLEALKRLAGRPNQLLQENTVMLQRQLRSPKQKHNIITQPPLLSNDLTNHQFNDPESWTKSRNNTCVAMVHFLFLNPLGSLQNDFHAM